MDRIVYRHTRRDNFWIELRTEVAAYLEENNEDTHYSFGEGVARISYHIGIYFALSYLTWVQGSYLAAAALGFHMICTLANIAHMATHSGFTRSRLLDFLALSLYDLSGTSGLEWQIAHQTHHNQPHSSIDYQTNGYARIGVRIHDYMPWKAHHKYQPLYFWIVICSYLPFKLFATSLWLYRNRQFIRFKYEALAHIAARLSLLSQVACAAYLHGGGRAAALFAVYALAYSQTAFILLFNNHEETHKPLGEKGDVQPFHERLSWADIQVRTSGDWRPSNWLLRLIEFQYGYFNYHIEHHLFPTLKPSLLKKIAPIVERVCRKNGVTYISTSFWDVQKSLAEHLLKLSVPDKQRARGSRMHCQGRR